MIQTGLPGDVLQRAADFGMLTDRAATLASWGAAETDQPCFRMQRDGGTGKPRLYVYGMIGGWRLDSQRFVQQVHAIESMAFDLHVNSPGGFVHDAVAMFQAVRSHPAQVTAHIDGLAASAASFLALAADEVVIAEGAREMIHDAQGIAMGSPALMREAADLGDSISDDIAGLYAARAGGKRETWRAAMRATTWYSARQAVDVGLADRLATPETPGPDNRTRLIQARHRALTTPGG